MKRPPGPRHWLRAARGGRTGPDRAATEGWAGRRRVCTSAPRGGIRQAPRESEGGNLEPVAAARSSCPRAAGTPPECPPPGTFPPHPLRALHPSPLSSAPPTCAPALLPSAPRPPGAPTAPFLPPSRSRPGCADQAMYVPRTCVQM